MARLLDRRYVYGYCQRGLHWLIALSTLFMAISGIVGSKVEAGADRAYWWDLHILCGYALIVALMGRITWGIIGPKHARFTALCFPRAWLHSLTTLLKLPVQKSFQDIKSTLSLSLGSADGHYGHHPQASLAYLSIYLILSLLCSTGLALAAMLHSQGPLTVWFEDSLDLAQWLSPIHEVGMWVILVLVSSHIVALIYHEWQDQIPLAQSMVSGYQYRSVKQEQSNEETTSN